MVEIFSKIDCQICLHLKWKQYDVDFIEHKYDKIFMEKSLRRDVFFQNCKSAHVRNHPERKILTL